MIDPRRVLSHPRFYRIWQAPFVRKKLRLVLESGMIAKATTVLDVGCGPGINAAVFVGVERYVGVDLSEDYISFASNHYAGDFRVADVTKPLPDFGRFDLVFANSLMHHLDDDGVRRLLQSLPEFVSRDGEIHIIDLVLADRGIPRRLALADRGAYPRRLEDWRRLIGSHLHLLEVRSFHVGLGRLALWELVYVRASASAVLS